MGEPSDAKRGSGTSGTGVLGPSRKSYAYKTGELEVILSLAPTDANIGRLAALLGRSEDAIKLVYRIAFGHGPFGRTAIAQAKKVLAAKKVVGIAIGRQTLPRPSRNLPES